MSTDGLCRRRAGLLARGAVFGAVARGRFFENAAGQRQELLLAAVRDLPVSYSKLAGICRESGDSEGLREWLGKCHQTLSRMRESGMHLDPPIANLLNQLVYGVKQGRPVLWINSRDPDAPVVLLTKTPSPSARPWPTNDRDDPLKCTFIGDFPARAKGLSLGFHRLAAFHRDRALWRQFAPVFINRHQAEGRPPLRDGARFEPTTACGAPDFEKPSPMHEPPRIRCFCVHM